jgi:rieske iron-sulfur protein
MALSQVDALAAEDEKTVRPRKGDRLVFAYGERAGQVIAPEDLPLGGPQQLAFPMDPVTKVVRDGSLLNQVALVRLDPAQLSPDTRPEAADGIVAYSAVCTHTGCDAWDWQPASATVKCPCHFSEFDLKAAARVLNGPAPRRLPALPLKIADAAPAVAAGFVGRPGFESGGA